MSNKPSLSISFSDGNILPALGNIDGIAAFGCTAISSGNQNKLFIVHSLDEAVQQGITATAEPCIYRHIKEFYAELGGTQELRLQTFPFNHTMEKMLDVSSENNLNKLIISAKGTIAYLGIFKSPLPLYDGGNDFIDADAAEAFVKAKTFVQFHNSKLRFFRVIIEGKIATENSSDIFEPFAQNNPYAGMLLGSTVNDGSASVGLALGRKVKYAAHIKMGKVANGPLAPNKIFIGTKELSEQDTAIVPAAPEVKATAAITILTTGVDGDCIYSYGYLPNGNAIYLGLYTKINTDNTPTLIATGFAAAINANTAQTGFSASSSGAVITITAAAGYGAAMNNQINMVQGFHNGGGNSSMNFSNTNYTGGVDAIGSQTFQTDVYHNKGFVSFLTHPTKAGFYFGVDNMGTRGDYRFLAHGAVVDVAARIVTATYLNMLESEVPTAADGTIEETSAVYLEELLQQRVVALMGERISGVEVIVDRTVNIINTSKLKVKVRVRPVGYLTYIEVELGLTAGGETV